MKKVIFTKRASNALGKHSNRATLIKSKIQLYATDPVSQANQVTALTGSNYLRLRVGDFRVIFFETAEAITIVDLGPRGEIYRAYG
jgi:mRNA interferase RelE/StbE